MDVTSLEDWQNCLKVAKSKLGGLDILVNNAGWTYRVKDTITTTEAEYDRNLTPQRSHSRIISS